MPYAHGMSLQVTVVIAPENVDEFFAAFKPVFEKVIAEPECLFFEVYVDPCDPGKITWIEDWSKTPEWFLEKQITKEYYKPYLAITEPMFLKPREGLLLERVKPEFFYVKQQS
ncbi:hypothetical protein F4861DRAFT_237168 [Xylaria intraflava]|nr:hypothetical protein F4861DRAFT_237168 [Xylaria intraflava]